ncbi:MAG: hypothetical protein R3F54_11835 [Alphaproteobacteria bacterium]
MSTPAGRRWPWHWGRRGESETQDAGAADDKAPVPPRPEVLLEDSALRTRYRVEATPSFMFISMFGMTAEAIAERADLVDEELAEKGLVPVYLLDEADFSSLRAPRRLFEYLPSHWQGVRHAPDLDWPFYLRRRYLLLQAKWQPIGRIDFGDLPDWLPDHQDSVPAPDAQTPRS